MKVLILLLTISIFFLISGMQTSINPLYLSKSECRESRFPRTQLHDNAILDFRITSVHECTRADTIKSQIAANLILENKEQVDDLDDYEISAYEYAEVNQYRLPKLWQIMQSGKLVQEIQKRVPPIPQETEFLAWCHAWKLIKECANAKSH